MAHADYHDCALCDSKLDYGGIDAPSKERMCADCAVALALDGVIARSGAELVKWITDNDAEKVREVLTKHGFQFCYYPNDVDDAVKAKGLEQRERLEGSDQTVAYLQGTARGIKAKA